MESFPPSIICRVIAEHYFPYRGLVRCAPGGVPGDPPPLDNDSIIGGMERHHHIRLEAIREHPRGARRWVVVLVLSSDSKYYHTADLRKLIAGVHSERPAREGLLDELIIVAEDDFFTQKHSLEVIAAAAEEGSKGADPEGVGAHYRAVRYHVFSFVVPEHKSVARHRIMSSEETAELFKRERISRGDLPVILTGDPPIIWLGARAGQCVEITADSPIAGTAVRYRRVEQGPP